MRIAFSNQPASAEEISAIRIYLPVGAGRSHAGRAYRPNTHCRYAAPGQRMLASDGDCVPRKDRCHSMEIDRTLYGNEHYLAIYGMLPGQ